jgi:hypothetical protein
MQTSISGCRMLGFVVMVALLHACDGPKSSTTGEPAGGPVLTSAMYIYLTVESSEPGIAEVRANLHDHPVGGETFRLDGGDYFRACMVGVCRNMADNNSIFVPDYIARFDYRPGVDYVVSFNRQQGGNAPNSRVVLPPVFNLLTPANGQQVTGGENVAIEWSPTGTPAQVELSYYADCTFVSGPHGTSFGTLSTDDVSDGRESVSIDAVVAFTRRDGVPAVTRCSIDVTVSHKLPGQIDPAFHGGIAFGIVSRKVRLDYVPR